MTVSGGLAPSVMGRRYEVDVPSLDERTRSLFAMAVEAARGEAPPPPNPSARDARSYEIHITDEGGKSTMVVEDGGILPGARTLINLIKAHAR